MMEGIVRCDLPEATYFVFGDNVPPFVLYSHLPVIIAALLLGSFVLLKGKRQLPAIILFFMIAMFAIWTFLDSIFWASNRSDVIMTVWSLILLIEPLVYVAGFYLFYVMTRKEDLPFLYKAPIALLLLPLFIFVPTRYGLSGFDLASCLSIEGFIAKFYTYGIEITLTLTTFVFAIREYWKAHTDEKRHETFYLSAGIMSLFLAFGWGNITGSFTENWFLGQFGLFGMPVFIGFLAYLLVRFKLFDIKLISAHALVVTLWLLVFALLFVKNLDAARILVVITLVISFILGFILVRSVQKEVETREELAIANERLKELDQRKTEFLSLASHQLRSPLTAIKGYASLILEGSYGAMPDNLKEPVQRVFQSANRLVAIVEDFLTISRIELNKLVYNFANIDMKKVAETIIEELRPVITGKGLNINLEVEDKCPCTVRADYGKIAQVMTNLIDNASKYTISGTIKVKLSFDEKKKTIRFGVHDTGIGMSRDTIDKLFRKFTRGGGVMVNVTGTGLGLYVAFQIVEAHHGRLWAESEGEGKGSTFNLELPMV